MQRQEATELLTELFESWYPSLLRYSFRMTRDMELAEDIVQESLLDLYRELARGGTVDNPKGWTLTVARRRIFRQQRGERRQGVRVDVENLDAMPAGTGPELREFLFGEIAELFSLLSPREIEVLLLRMESMKYREIGAQLGISANSVTTLLSRALRKLRLAVAGPLGRKSGEEAHVPKTLL
jgi:RNA polymerase sigma factor (sigma-70 family)